MPIIFIVCVDMYSNYTRGDDGMEKEINSLNFAQFIGRYSHANKIVDKENCCVVFTFNDGHIPLMCKINKYTNVTEYKLKIMKIVWCALGRTFYIKTNYGWKMFYKQNVKMHNNNVIVCDTESDLYNIKFI